MTFNVDDVREFNRRTRHLANELNHRHTGRTFRMLLEACKNLSEGHEIIIVAVSKSYANQLKNKVADMMRSYLSDEYISDAMCRIFTACHENFDKDSSSYTRGSNRVVIRDHYRG